MLLLLLLLLLILMFFFSFLFWTDQQINEPTDRQLAQCKIVKISQAGVEVMMFQRHVKTVVKDLVSKSIAPPVTPVPALLTPPPWLLMTPLRSPGRGFLLD